MQNKQTTQTFNRMNSTGEFCKAKPEVNAACSVCTAADHIAGACQQHCRKKLAKEIQILQNDNDNEFFTLKKTYFEGYSVANETAHHYKDFISVVSVVLCFSRLTMNQNYFY